MMPARAAMATFNMFSRNKSLGIIFEETRDEKAANVLFSSLPGHETHGEHQPFREPHKADDPRPVDILAKSIIRVSLAPMVGSADKKRLAGVPVKIMIALHELIHACGLDDAEHTSMGDPDAFSTGFDVIMGDNPSGIDDQLKLGSTRLPPHGDAPVQDLIKPRTLALIRKNWT